MSDALEKINSQIQYALSYIIRDRHPEIIVSITDVSTTPDLEYSDIMVSELHDDERVVLMLNNEVKTIRKLLAESANIRKIPLLRFYIDKSESSFERIENLLDKK